MQSLIPSPLALLSGLSPSLRGLAIALCVFTFLLGFVLWFLHYVRLEKPEHPEGEE
jgi:hypothetical protein